jgi:hypothetical protein
MRGAVAVACSLLLACTKPEPANSDGAAVDSAVTPACMEATQHSDLAWIEQNVFEVSCVFSSCHSGTATTPSTTIDLHVGQSRAHLVNVASMLDPSRSLVIPSTPRQSWLLVMLGQIAPGDADPPANPLPTDVGTMPQGTGGQLLCPEKRDAIERWIAAGAN